MALKRLREWYWCAQTNQRANPPGPSRPKRSTICSMCHFRKLKLLVWDQKKNQTLYRCRDLHHLLFTSPEPTHPLLKIDGSKNNISFGATFNWLSETFSKLSVIAFSATIGLEKSAVAAVTRSEVLIVATAARSEGLMVAAATGLWCLTVPAATTAAGSWGLALVAVESASLLPMVDSFLLVDASLMVDASLSPGIPLYLVPRMSFRSLWSGLPGDETCEVSWEVGGVG